MIVTFKKPIEGIRGKVYRKDGYYVRRIYGQYVLQRCPNRTGHIATEKEKANQERFIREWKKRRQNTDDADGIHYQNFKQL